MQSWVHPGICFQNLFLLKGIPACRDELPAWVGDGKASDGSHLTRTGTSDQNISFEATFSLASMTCAFLLDLVLKHNIEHVARYCRHRGFQEIRHCLMLRPRSIDLLWCKLQWRHALVASADLLYHYKPNNTVAPIFYFLHYITGHDFMSSSICTFAWFSSWHFRCMT